MFFFDFVQFAVVATFIRPICGAFLNIGKQILHNLCSVCMYEHTFVCVRVCVCSYVGVYISA